MVYLKSIVFVCGTIMSKIDDKVHQTFEFIIPLQEMSENSIPFIQMYFTPYYFGFPMILEIVCLSTRNILVLMHEIGL